MKLSGNSLYSSIVCVFLTGCLTTRRVHVDELESSGKEELPNSKYRDYFETELMEYEL